MQGEAKQTAHIMKDSSEEANRLADTLGGLGKT
jgi:hypothetical protein